MKLIIENPYRRLGILVGTTLREQTRQINKLKMFIEAVQEINYEEYSFESLGILERNIDKIEQAANRLNLNHDKVESALFWFYDGYTTDAPAFEFIKEGYFEGAKTIWEDLINKNIEVTQRSASAYSNLSTLLMCGLSFSGITKAETFEKGIFLKLKLLESDFFVDFIQKATGDKFVISKSELQQIFLKNIFEENEKTQILSFESLIELINLQNFSAKDKFLKKTLQKLINEIESRIGETKKTRSKKPQNSSDFAKELIKETKLSIDILNRVLKKTDLNLASISDKLSNEILQCGIEYFSHYKESNIEPSNTSMELFLIAKSLAIGNIAKQRCEENTDYLKKWIRDKPEREKKKQLENDLVKLLEIVKEYQNLNSGNIITAKSFLTRVDNKYRNLVSVLGVNDKNTNLISDRIIEIAWKFTKSEIELQLNYFKANGGVNSKKAIKILLGTINNSITFLNELRSYSISSNLNRVLTREQSDLVQFRDKINDVKPSGCYIATMAYGNYDHPQVMILRQFRDEVLNQTLLGKWFVIVYYMLSPWLVQRLKGIKLANIFFRLVLDSFIFFIKKIKNDINKNKNRRFM
jgi:hypothetical protein